MFGLASTQSPGQLVERVTSITDTTQAYALYLPPGYTTARRWPILYVLDPRGRALVALDLFKDAASQLGWIVLSSYNSLSDGPPEPNERAMNAMLAAGDELGGDASRTYLAGFSGTARAVLQFAVRLRGRVAGVVAAGGALGFQLGGPETAFAGDPGFAYFGAAGVRDFNYEEVRAMGERFRTTRVPTRVVLFDGPHRWPPAAICGEALEWLELRAMVAGLRVVDSAWVEARLERELASAAQFDQVGRWDEALRLADAIASDYAGWPGASQAATRAAALRADAVLRRYETEGRRLAERDARQGTELLEGIRWARAQREPPSVAALDRRLRIGELQRVVARGDSLEAASAERLLARIFVFLSFYVPRADLADAMPDRARRMFEAALTIGPIQGEGCALLRQALAAATPVQRARFAGECTS
ncbi:MAG TPA: hypothetical protein VGA20_11870 [Gemmatimonadales bacterium]